MSADNWTSCPKCGGSLREDYEQGIYKGSYFVDYRGECQDCDFLFTYNYKKSVKNIIKEVKK